MAGSTAIKIYRSPLKIKAKLKPQDQPQEGGPAVALKVKSYDSYLVVYYFGGKRVRCRFNSLQEARDKANAVHNQLINNNLEALSLTGKDSLVFTQATAIAKKFGLTLDQLAREFAEAREILGDVSLIEAARFYDRYGKTVKQHKAVPDIVKELVDGLKADNKSEYHIRDTERRLTTFANAFPGQIMQVTTTQISDWLRNLKGSDRKGRAVEIAPKTRNHYRNAVVHLFNHARDYGYLPKGMPTDAEAVKTLDVVTPTNEIFTVEDIQKVLNSAPARLVVPMAIKAFCGIRTEEMLNLKWEHLNLETKYITLPSEVTKTKQRRLVPMPDNLIAWLTPYKKAAGRICERWQRPQALFQAFDRHGKRQGVDVGANKFRNSYISYRVAVTHDVAKVALESGNSPRIIQREYLELATEADGKRWFAVFPPEAPQAKKKVKAPKKKGAKAKRKTKQQEQPVAQEAKQ